MEGKGQPVGQFGPCECAEGPSIEHQQERPVGVGVEDERQDDAVVSDSGAGAGTNTGSPGWQSGALQRSALSTNRLR